MLVPVGSAYTPSDFDINRVGGKFKALKEHLYFGNLSGPHNPLTDIPTTLEDSLKEIQDYMEQIHTGRISDVKEILAFFHDDLKEIIKIFVGKQYKLGRDLKILSLVQPFIFQVFVFCLELLHLDSLVILETLQMLLNTNSNCYAHSTFTSPKDTVNEIYRRYPLIFSICPLTNKIYNENFSDLPIDLDTELEKVLFGRDPNDGSLWTQAAKNVQYPGTNFINTARIYQKTSILYLLNVNYFVQIGGLSVLSDYLKSSHAATNILLGSEIINQMIPCLDDDFNKENTLPYLSAALSSLPSTLNPEEIKHAKKDEIVQLIKTFKNITKNSPEGSAFSETIASYELEILIICLKSQYLDKRIFAISTLIEKISEVERTQKSLFKPKEPSISKEAYIKFLEGHDIVSILLGESSHSELLRRSSPLFRFLFRNKRISMERVDFICRLAFEKHDTFRKQILKILADLAELMDCGELEHLFDNISQVGVQEIDQDVLQLVKTIGNNISTVRVANSRKKRKTPEDTDDRAYDSDGKDRSNNKETIFNLVSEHEQRNPRVVVLEEHMEQENNESEIRKRKGPELDLEGDDGIIEDFNEEQRRGLGQKVLDFLWKFILGLPDVKVGNAPLVTSATNILKDILSGKLESEKMRFIGKTVNAIKRNLAVGEAFEILQQVMKSRFPLKKEDGSDLSNKRELILYLDSEYSLTNTIFNSLIQLKKELVGYLTSEANFPSEDKGMVIEEQVNQKEETDILEGLRNPKDTKSESNTGPVVEEDSIVGEKIDEEIQNHESRVEETKEIERNSVSTGASSIDELSDGRALAARRPHFLMKSSENPSVGEVITSYIKEIENRLRFVRSLKSTSYDQLEFKHANLLWNLLVENALYEQERDLFFTFFANIVYSSSTDYKILSEDVINYIFSDILLNLDFHNYTLQSFNCFIEFFKYLNTRYNLIKQQNSTFSVQSLELIGLDSLWEVFFNSQDTQVVSKAQEFLLSLFKRVAEKKQRATLVETSVKHIEKAYKNLKEKEPADTANDSLQRISRCLDFISTFLQEFGELHSQNHSFSPDSAIHVYVNNQMNNAMAPKKFALTLYKTMTVREAKELIASRINPPATADEVMLMCSGNIMSGDNTLLEDLPYKIENEHTIMCSKNTTVEDLDTSEPYGPSLPNENSEEFENKVSTLKSFVEAEDDLIRYVLKKKNGDMETAAMSLLDASDLETLKTQFEKEKEKTKKKDVKKNNGTNGVKADDEVRLSEMLANNDEIFELFFKLLTLDIEELEAKVWYLLMNLPLNRNMYHRLRNVFQKSGKHKGSRDLDDGHDEHGNHSKSDNIGQELDWNAILNAASTSKLLYSLRIVSNLVSCGVLDERDSELYIKSEWRQNFVEYQGLSYLQGLLQQFSESALLRSPSQGNVTQKSHNTEARIFSLILDIFRVYIQPALLVLANKSKRELIQEVFTEQNKGKTDGNAGDKSTSNPPRAGWDNIKSDWSNTKSAWDQADNPLAKDWPVYQEKRPNTPTFGWETDQSQAASAGSIPIPMPAGAPESSGFNVNNLWKSTFNNNESSTGGLWNKVIQNNNNNNPPAETYEKIDESQAFLKAVEEDHGQLAKKILDNINFEEFIVKGLKVVEVSMQFIDNDTDLAKLVEDEFKLILPCFVAYPRLLQLLYQFEGVKYIEKAVFFRSHQDTVKNTVAYMIMFLAKFSHKILDKDFEAIHGTGRMSVESAGDDNQMIVEDIEYSNEAANHQNNHVHHDVNIGKNIKEVVKESPQSFFLKTLLPLAYDCKTEEDISLEYFETISSLIKLTPKEITNTITDLASLYIFAIKSIRDRPIMENRSSEVGDKVLRGFLQLAETLLRIEPGVQRVLEERQDPDLQHIDLLKDLYDFLFYLPGENEKIDPSLNLPKCKHKKTRSHVFRLLKLLSANNKENLSRMIDLLSLNHKKLPNFISESSSSSIVNFELKNSTGYVGMKNLGCTCYMNSLIQQFFMTVTLRNALLNAEVSVKIPGPVEGEEEQVFLSQISREVFEANEKYLETQLTENVLYQLQVLLGHLGESVSECVVPQKFFDSIKTINGERIVVNIQQDVNEFFNTLCDKLEHCMKETPQKTVLNDLIGGTLSHEIISLETDYPYYGEREEAYLTIPLDIKNKRNIYEALDFYVKEDILEGDNKYNCEQYDRKIKVMKRCCIKTLPNTLIITLKRFDFDFVSMQKVKINDYFEFPTTLNVKPWTKCGLKDQIPAEANYEPPNYGDDYYDYELVGVLVHSGTADAGHYYSFIKDRSNSKRGWFEFNDNRVRPFDIKNLKNECFGSDGIESKSVYDFEFVKSRSAYILFYERSMPEEDNSTYKKYKDTEVPQNLCETIWRENLEVLRSKYFYDVDYFKFVLDLFKLYQFPIVSNIPESYSEPPEMNTLRKEAERTQKMIQAMEKFDATGEMAEAPVEGIAVEDVEEDIYDKHTKALRLAVVLASEIYMKNKDPQQFEGWIELLQNAMEKFVPGNIWLLKFINQNPDFLKLMYGEGISSTVKEAVNKLLTRVISKVHHIEAGFFTQEEEFKLCNSQYKLETKTVRKSSLARFLKIFIQSFFKGKKDLSKPLDYFDLVLFLIRMNRLVAHFLIYEGLLMDSFDLFLQIQKILHGGFTIGGAVAKEKEKYHSTNVILIFQIVESLIRSCVTASMVTTKTLPPSYLFEPNVDWETCPKLPEKITERIMESDNFTKFFLPMQEKCNVFYPVLQHICWEDLEVSKKAIQQLVSQVCSFMANARTINEHTNLLYHLIMLKDQYQAFRIQFLFTEHQSKTIIATTRGHEVLAWMLKSRDSYDKVPCIIAIRWLSKMIHDIPLFKDYIMQNLEKFEWIPSFLDQNMHTKQGFYSIIDTELNARIPQDMKKSFEIFSSIIPVDVKPRVEAVQIDTIEEENEEKEKEKEKENPFKGFNPRSKDKKNEDKNNFNPILSMFSKNEESD